MLLAVALFGSPVFPACFFGYDSDAPSHTGSFSMSQSWVGGDVRTFVENAIHRLVYVLFRSPFSF